MCDLPSVDDLTDMDFEAMMSVEHATDTPPGSITPSEVDALVKAADEEIPADIQAGKHHEPSSTSASGQDSDASESDISIDINFDPESIHPVDMSNPEVNLKHPSNTR